MQVIVNRLLRFIDWVLGMVLLTGIVSLVIIYAFNASTLSLMGGY